MLGWIQRFMAAQYQDLAVEMEGYDARLIAAEQKLNELDLRLQRYIDRLPPAHDEGEAHVCS